MCKPGDYKVKCTLAEEEFNFNQQITIDGVKAIDFDLDSDKFVAGKNEIVLKVGLIYFWKT